MGRDCHHRLGLQVKSTEKEKDPQARRWLGSPLRSDLEKMKYEPTSLKKMSKRFWNQEQNEGWAQYRFLCPPLLWNQVRAPCVPRRAIFRCGVLGSSGSIWNGLSTFRSSSQHFLRASVSGMCLWDLELVSAADTSICYSEDSFWEESSDR